MAGADLRAALMGSCLRGALPPVDMRAVGLVRTMIDVDGSESFERETDSDLACCGSESFERETDSDLACCGLNKPDRSSTSVTF